MGRTLTNSTSVAYAIESTVGTLPGSPTWRVIEPNDITEYGAQISTTARDPISKDRQRRKGATTDLDSTAAFDLDLTMSHFTDFVEGFMFATAVNSNMVFTASDATSSGYTISAATAAQAGKLQWVSGGHASLVYARGYDTSGNNALKVLTADTASSGTLISVSGNSAETAPTNAEVELAGVRAQAGDLAVTVSAGVATLTSGNNSATDNIDFTTLGWTVGQFIHIGGLTSSNQLGAGASYGYGRLKTIGAASCTLDKLDSTLITDNGAGDTVDLLFGRFIRNVDTDSSEFLIRSYQFEVGFEGLDTDESKMWQYSLGNYCNELSVDMPLSEKSTMTANFVGTDTENPTDTQKTNASTPVNPVATNVFDTVNDIGRLRITDVDETGLTTCFKSATLTISNNVSPEKCLGTLGATYMNHGMFEIDLDAELLFTNAAVINRIRDNTTVTMDFRVNNDQGAIFFDIPSCTLGDGGYTFTKNESTRINVSVQAFKDGTLDTSLGVSLFPVVP